MFAVRRDRFGVGRASGFSSAFVMPSGPLSFDSAETVTLPASAVIAYGLETTVWARVAKGMGLLGVTSGDLEH
jgi:hypothetical protein